MTADIHRNFREDHFHRFNFGMMVAFQDLGEEIYKLGVVINTGAIRLQPTVHVLMVPFSGEEKQIRYLSIEECVHARFVYESIKGNLGGFQVQGFQFGDLGYVGKRIKNKFRNIDGRMQVYVGVVVANNVDFLNPPTYNPYQTSFHVVYEDEDREDLSLVQLNTLITSFDNWESKSFFLEN